MPTSLADLFGWPGMLTLHTSSAMAGGGADAKDGAANRLREVASRGLSFAGASGVWIASLLPDGLLVRAAAGAAVEPGTRIALDGGLADICIQSGRIVRSDDLETDRRAGASIYRSLGGKSALMVPVKSAGKVCGILAALSPTPNGFTRTHVAVLLTLADVVAETFAAELLPQQTRPSPLPQAAPNLSQQQTSTSAKLEVAPFSPSTPASSQQVSPARNAQEPRMPVFSSGTVQLTLSSLPQPLPAHPNLVQPVTENRPAAPNPPPTPLAVIEAPPAQPPLVAAPKPEKPFGSMAAAESPKVQPGQQALNLAAREQFHSRSRGLPLLKAAGALTVFAVAGIGGWALRITASDVAPPRVHWSAPAAPEIVSDATSAPPEAPPQAQAVQASSQQSAPSQQPPLKKLAEKESLPEETADALTAIESPEAVRQPSAAHLSRPEVLSVAAPAIPLSASLPVLSHPQPTTPTPKWEVKPAVLIRRVLPEYPAVARNLNLEGSVQLELSLDKSGAVVRARVLSGRMEFQHAALEAVRQWRYQPATMAGQPVESSAVVEVNFRLPHPH